MTIKSAEVTKIGIDGFLATKMTYANLISNLMEKMGIGDEINLVLESMGGDSRIGKKYLKNTYGFGGASIPKSNRALVKYLKDLELNNTLPLSVNTDNDYQIQLLKSKYIQLNPDKTIPFVFDSLGVINDRLFDESQELKLCIELLDEGYTIHTYKTGVVPSDLLRLSENYENKIKFFKPGSSSQGYEINL
jgi:UDPglucose 6-dehydrogenase